jgi:hypothetical protein
MHLMLPPCGIIVNYITPQEAIMEHTRICSAKTDLSSTMMLKSCLAANSSKEFGMGFKAGMARYEVKLPVYELMMTTHIRHQVLSIRRVTNALSR